MGLHFIKVNLMAMGVGWVLRVKPVEETIGINLARNYARTKAVAVEIGNTWGLELTEFSEKMMMVPDFLFE